MTQISRSALVPYSAAQMFILVDTITEYPEFLPWCSAAEEHERHQHEVLATVHLARAGLRHRFTTRNQLRTDEEILMQLVDGPFSQLQGAWRFKSLSDTASKVTLDIEFEFNNRLLGATLGPVFSQICNGLVDAFLKRAQERYGH